MRVYICPACGSMQKTELELPLFSEAQCKRIKCTACGKGSLVGIGEHETDTNARHLDVETWTYDAMFFSVRVIKDKRVAEARAFFLINKRKGFRTLIKKLRKILNDDYRFESVVLTDRATDWYLRGNDDDGKLKRCLTAEQRLNEKLREEVLTLRLRLEGMKKGGGK